MNIQRMQTTIKHTRIEINAHPTNYGSSNGFAVFQFLSFFFFLPQIHLFFVQTSYAWNIAYINYAAAILFYRSSVLTFQLFKLIYFYDILLPSRIPSRNIGSIMRFNSLYVFQYLKILFLIIKYLAVSFLILRNFSSILLDMVLNRYLVKYTACVIA